MTEAATRNAPRVRGPHYGPDHEGPISTASDCVHLISVADYRMLFPTLASVASAQK
jgi:hypothetical protein